MSSSQSGASGLGKSVKNEVPAVDADGKPTFDLTNDYKEPVEVPMFLNLKKKSWEIIINEAHLNSTHCLRLPRHLFDEGVLIPEKNITITELDHELDAVDSIYCDVEADSEDPHKRYIVGGWDKFVRERKIDIGDRLLFTIENVPDHIFVQFIDSDHY